MSPKPIRVFYSELSGRFFASQRYKENPQGGVTITGAKFDVTNDIGAAMVKHDLEFVEHGAAFSGKLPRRSSRGKTP